MKFTEEEIYIIQVLKEKFFRPKDNSYNESLYKLQREGWLDIKWKETRDVPIIVTPSKDFVKKYKQYFE